MESLYIENFNPKGKEYYFNACTEDFCYKTRHGICSLDLTEDEIALIQSEKYPKTDDVNYCRDIYQSILKDGQKSLILINSNKCGHYTFDDGQHRVCIASKKGLNLKADICQNNNVCHICRKENIIQKSISYAEASVKMNTYKRNILLKILNKKQRNYYEEELDKFKKNMSNYQIIKDRDFRKF